MFGEAISYPRSNDDWLPTIAIGGILLILQFLIVPVIVVQGYYVRVLRGVSRGESEAPSFTDWGDLLVDGLRLLVVGLGYGLLIGIPAVVLSAIAGGGAAAIGGEGGGAIAVLVSLVVFVFSLVVSYVIPAAMANFATEDSIAAAFDFGTLREIVTTAEYARGILFGVLVAIVGGLVGALLSVVLIGIFVLFYVQIGVYYCFARGYADGREAAGLSRPA
ncbi:MAG: DUF4013 domain-containing protein [Haloferacaceae archaeon]